MIIIMLVSRGLHMNYELFLNYFVAVFPLFYGLKLSAPGAEFQCSGNIKIDSEYSEQTRERTESASGNWNQERTF